MYDVVTSPNVPEGVEVIFPISLGELYHSGDKLRALLGFAKKIQQQNLNSGVVVLIADTLRRWNSDRETAKNMGDKFLEEYAHELSGLKYMRWDEWLELYKKEYMQASDKIEKKYNEDNLFKEKIRKTYERTKKGKDLESSIKYQKEEFSCMLTMKGKCLVYPAKTSLAWAYLYDLFPGEMPEHVEAKYIKNNCELKVDSILEKKIKVRNDQLTVKVLLEISCSFLDDSRQPKDSKTTYLRLMKECLPKDLKIEDLKADAPLVIKLQKNFEGITSSNFLFKMILKSTIEFLNDDYISIQSKLTFLEVLQCKLLTTSTSSASAPTSQSEYKKVEIEGSNPLQLKL